MALITAAINRGGASGAHALVRWMGMVAIGSKRAFAVVCQDCGDLTSDEGLPLSDIGTVRLDRRQTERWLARLVGDELAPARGALELVRDLALLGFAIALGQPVTAGVMFQNSQ